MDTTCSFDKLNIVNTTVNDLAFTFNLFEAAIVYQKKNGYELWPQFSQQLIKTEINEKRHWKIMYGEDIVCVFSVMYSDPIIWLEKNNEPSVYLHRIAINPLFKGKGIMKLIRKWAIDHAKQHQKKYVRMDTWGNNETLRSYYINCGFKYIGQQYLTQTKGLPGHYGGDVLSLFEIKIE